MSNTDNGTERECCKLTCAAVIVAAGEGRRMGRPKQLLPVGGVPMLERSIAEFSKLPEVCRIVVVATEELIERYGEAWAKKNIISVTGGSTRLDSVRAGVRQAAGAGVIAVHDAARPLIRAEQISAAIAEARKSGASVLAVPVKDTIKAVSADGKTVVKTLDRKTLWAAQTPQCYRLDVLESALAAFPEEKEATDESQLVERNGGAVTLVPGLDSNIKVTTPADLAAANAFLGSSSDEGKMRVGLGYDIHRMVPGRPLIMGGIRIPHTKGLLGHSDGDVILHAACDAALGAIAAGEIGIYFPPTDLTIMGISSIAIVEKTVDVLASRGAAVAQLDITVIAEEPKLSGHYPALRKSVADLFRLPIDNVSIKAKSYEGLGEIGRGEAMACHALAVVRVK